MILQNHRRLPASIFSVKLAALRSLKRVIGRIFKISKQFQRSKLKLSTKQQKFFKTTVSAHVQKVRYLFIIINLQKNIHRVTQSL
jgi:hypothetical protein